MSRLRTGVYTIWFAIAYAVVTTVAIDWADRAYVYWAQAAVLVVGINLWSLPLAVGIGWSAIAILGASCLIPSTKTRMVVLVASAMAISACTVSAVIASALPLVTIVTALPLAVVLGVTSRRLLSLSKLGAERENSSLPLETNRAASGKRKRRIWVALIVGVVIAGLLVSPALPYVLFDLVFVPAPSPHQVKKFILEHESILLASADEALNRKQQADSETQRDDNRPMINWPRFSDKGIPAAYHVDANGNVYFIMWYNLWSNVGFIKRNGQAPLLGDSVEPEFRHVEHLFGDWWFYCAS